MARTKMTNAEKAEVTAIREYLKALEQNAPRRGRKRTPDGIRSQLTSVATEMEGSTVTRQLDLVQQRINLEDELEALEQAGSIDLSALEANFVDHAAAYGGRRGISYAAWREVGVSAATLKAAGIRRST